MENSLTPEELSKIETFKKLLALSDGAGWMKLNSLDHGDKDAFIRIASQNTHDNCINAEVILDNSLFTKRFDILSIMKHYTAVSTEESNRLESAREIYQKKIQNKRQRELDDRLNEIMNRFVETNT